GQDTQGHRQWVWMDRAGKTLGRAGAPLNAETLRLSPDGKRVAFSEAVGSAEEDLWIYDLDRDVRTQLTTNPETDHWPIWSPDGSQLAFDSGREGYTYHAPYQKPSSGAVAEHLLFQADPKTGYGLQDWSLDGRFVVFTQQKQPTAVTNEIWILPLYGDRKPF